MNNVADKKLRKTLLSIILTMTLAIASVFLVSSWITKDFQKQNVEHFNIDYEKECNSRIAIRLRSKTNCVVSTECKSVFL